MADLRLFTQAAPGSVVRQSRNNYRLAAGSPEGSLYTQDYLYALAREGRIFYATPGAAHNTVSTGAAQTSFSATAPDLTLEVPAGTTAIPLRFTAQQAGTVAGGAITALLAIQGAAERSSAGTAFANILSSRTDKLGVANACTPYIAPTVSADTVGVGIMRTILTQSVTTGRTGSFIGDIDYAFMTDMNTPIFLVGPSALKFYSFAASTAPSWFFSIAWAEIPSTDLTN